MRTALTQPAATSSCCPVNCLRNLTLGPGKQFCASLITNLVRLLVGKPGPLKLWAESLTVFFFIQVTLCPGKFKIFPLALIGSPDLRRLEVDVRLVAPFDNLGPTASGMNFDNIQRKMMSVRLIIRLV